MEPDRIDLPVRPGLLGLVALNLLMILGLWSWGLASALSGSANGMEEGFKMLWLGFALLIPVLTAWGRAFVAIHWDGSRFVLVRRWSRWRAWVLNHLRRQPDLEDRALEVAYHPGELELVREGRKLVVYGVPGGFHLGRGPRAEAARRWCRERGMLEAGG